MICRTNLYFFLLHHFLQIAWGLCRNITEPLGSKSPHLQPTEVPCEGLILRLKLPLDTVKNTIIKRVSNQHYD